MPSRSGFTAVVAGALLAAVTMMATLGAPAGAARRAAPDPAEPAPNAYLVADVDTGAVIAARDEHTPEPPASTMKLMTALVGLEHLALGGSLRVSALSAAQPAMRIGMNEGETWPVVDALHSLLMVSANDAAYAIAEGASGTLDRFAADMQTAGARLGTRDSTFKDPAGLDAEGESYEGGSRISAYDMGIIARNALAVPAIAETAKLLDYDFTGPNGLPHTLHNHNDTWLTGYEGATGLKPGYTEKAYRTLVASATRGGRSCVAVVFGIYDTAGWAGRLNDLCFATPVTAQARLAHLPPVGVATVDAREAAIVGFPRPLGAPAAAVAGARVERAVRRPPRRAAASASSTTRARGRSGVARAAQPATSTSSVSSTASGGGLLTLRNVVIVSLVVLSSVVLLRRRAVKHQRRRRLARQRALAEARRRGMLHVLDSSGRRRGQPPSPA